MVSAAKTSSTAARIVCTRASAPNSGTANSVIQPLKISSLVRRPIRSDRVPSSGCSSRKDTGRESGRERVCKYVYISLVAVSLKNNYKKQPYSEDAYTIQSTLYY